MLSSLQKWVLLIGFIGHFRKSPFCKAQDVKTWRADTNFLNPRNWENSQLPCANDRVIFPANSPIITFMPESFAAGELVLPVNGEIIFPENSAFELTGGTKEGDCVGKDVFFKMTTDFWFEPENWNITSQNAFPRIPNRRNAAVPHAFQVPCPTDKVEFPAESTFRLNLGYPLTSVAFMNINNEIYSQSKFDDLLQTRVGSLLFPDSPNIRITFSICNDETGCICENDGPNMLPTICMFVTHHCPDLECFDPIQPVGNCCPICGSMIQHKHHDRFKMEQLMNLHYSFLNKPEYQNVESFTSKTWEGTIQSVFVDGLSNKGLAAEVAKLIYDELISDVNGPQLYQVHSLEIRTSTQWEPGVSTYKHYSGMSSGGVAALIIVLLITLGLGAAYYIYKKRQISGFNFARFDLRGDKIELELGTTPHDELQPEDAPAAVAEEKSKGFDNPVYGTAVEEVPSTIEPISEVKTFVENPMFTIFEDSTGSGIDEK